jgi:hypothetical protein
MPFNLLVNDPHWGYQQIRGDGPTYEATLAGYMLLTVSLGFGGEGGWWAFPGAAHDHLNAFAPAWQVKVVQTGELYSLEAIPIGARTRAPVPHLPPGVVEDWNFIPPEATYDIDLVDGEGNFLARLQESGPVSRDGTDTSVMFLQPVGGKAWGDLLGHQPTAPTVPDLPEAARLGLEHGRFLPAVVQRYLAQTGEARESWLGWICPYCLCMSLIWPGSAYGYCPQCGADARTYLHGPPLSEGRYRLCHILQGPNRRRQEVWCGRWYRPLEYAETDAYLVMYQGLPRWVCQHPVLGEWEGGTWRPGTDAEELEQAWCQGGERLLVRPKLQIVGQVVGDARYRLRYRTDSGELRHLDFALTAGESGLKLLSAQAPVWAEARDPAQLLFIRRVTSVSLLEPAQDPGNHFYVVGDVPSLVLQRLRIHRAAASYFAIQLAPLALPSGPDLRRTPDGRLFVAFVREGDVYVAQRPSPQRPWSQPVAITAGGCYTDPSITILPAGVIVVAYTDATRGSQHLAISYDDGRDWERLG